MSEEIQPFRIEIPQADLDYLHDRLSTARWPGELPDVGWSRGVPLGLSRRARRALAHRLRLAGRRRRRLNEFPQFTTEIDGQRIHFLHVRSDRPDAKPLLITHGFPSSVAEFLHLIEPLVNPVDGPGVPRRRAVAARLRLLDAAGRDRLVDGPHRAGVGRADASARLQRYGVHGGDVGAGVSGTGGRPRRRARHRRARGDRSADRRERGHLHARDWPTGSTRTTRSTS